MLYEQEVTLKIKYNPETESAPEDWHWPAVLDMFDEDVSVEKFGPITALVGDHNWPEKFWGGPWCKVIEEGNRTWIVQNEDGDTFEIDVDSIAETDEGFVRFER